MTEPQEPAEFIQKLLRMMETNQHIICWNETETEIVIKDVKKMAQMVIPAFFRHAKYESFVRQLNMYNFHKVCREKNNVINFKNDLFFKGNESNFFRIKRKKKLQGRLDSETVEEQIGFIKGHPTLPQHFKELIIKLIAYKAEVVNHGSRIKGFFAEVNNDLKTPKFKRFDKDIQEMKSILENITERSENIDELFVSSKKMSTESQFQAYQQRLDCSIENPMIRARILGVHDHGSQLSIERYPDQNTFPGFTTKVSFVNIVDVPHRENWREQELDRLSACSIEDDLRQQ